MANAHLNITDSDPKFIARQCRKMADSFDPWHPVRRAMLAAIIGGVIVASMDFGDVWLCVGQCDAMQDRP